MALTQAERSKRYYNKQRQKDAAGIYEIRNTFNNKVYIGSSKNIKMRWKQHKYDLKRGINSRHLQHAYNKYGESAFRYSILHECKQDELEQWENHYIQLFKSYDRRLGYNMMRLAWSVPMTAETLAKKKAAQRNRRDNIVVEYKGEKRLLCELCEEFGHPTNTVKQRLAKGWPIEKALNDKSNAHIELLELDGDRKPLKTWCRLYNKDANAVKYRLTKGMSLREALEKESEKTYDGKTLKEWSKECGLAVHVLRGRLKTGWTLATAVSTPVIEDRTGLTADKITYNGKAYTWKELANEHGMKWKTLWHRVHDLGRSLEQAVAQKLHAGSGLKPLGDKALTTAERCRRQRDRRAALGLCLQCGKSEAEDSKYCPPCRQKTKDRANEAYRKKKAASLNTA